MMRASPSRPIVTALLAGSLLVTIFAAMVFWFRHDLRREIHQKIIERDAAVLFPVAVQQVAESEMAGSVTRANPFAPLTSLLKSVRQKGMLGIAVFDPDGTTVEAVPSTQLFVELPVDDYLRLMHSGTIARYHAHFPLDQYFAGIASERREAAVLEVLLALPGTQPDTVRGFVRYYIDARPLSQELAAIDRRIERQTTVTLGVGAILILAVVFGGSFSVQRAQRLIAERNERLSRANFELTQAAKSVAIGQITAHLVHGLQGSIAGLRAVVASQGGKPSADWSSAAAYTERLQAMIQETVALLADARANATYELSGDELATMIRDNTGAAAKEKGVRLSVEVRCSTTIDSYRGTLLYLIASNLAQNAIAATEANRRVCVTLTRDAVVTEVMVEDEGTGISEAVLKNLFVPGHSTRPGGSGLGLAISQHLARQIGAELALVRTGPSGTVFAVRMPMTPGSASPATTDPRIR